MQFRNAGLLLIVAAALFWSSWMLMPGVGVTDAQQIFTLVARHRTSVLFSVVTQLLSAALYVPALLGLSGAIGSESDSRIRWGAGLLLLGAIGSGIDAVLHLLAYAMTKPSLERGSLLEVMTFMQGPGLRLVGPFIVSFFVGGPLLSVALARKQLTSKTSLHIYVTALAIAIVGGVAASAGTVSARAVGLTVLGVISLAQACLGLELTRIHQHEKFAAAA